MNDITLGARIDLLINFDKYVRDIIGDDSVTDLWLTIGLPDGFDRDDLIEIASDESEWKGMCRAFASCIKYERD